jgi:CRP/FNR family transcriptional regulator, cyclic AMP receptor protein
MTAPSARPEQPNPIIGLLRPEERLRLAGQSAVLQFAAGEAILEEGQPPERIFLLQRGAVRVFHRSPAGREIVVMFCRAPAIFGELEVILDVPHIENVAALEEGTEVVAVPRAAFLAILEENVGVTRALLRDTCAKLAMASHNQKALACQDVRTRLATFLLSYALFEGERRGAAEVRIRTRLTQDDMAGALGVTRRAVADEIARWQKRGVLARQGGHYVICQLDVLSSEAAPSHIGLVYDSAAGLVVVPGSAPPAG